MRYVYACLVTTIDVVHYHGNGVQVYRFVHHYHGNKIESHNIVL